jgi:uncharacterized protein (TIGR03435 family)
LQGVLGVPVGDRTGLTAKYNIAIEWSANDADDGKPSLQGALSDLGLVLKRDKVPVDCLVIDTAEKATAN